MSVQNGLLPVLRNQRDAFELTFRTVLWNGLLPVLRNQRDAFELIFRTDCWNGLLPVLRNQRVCSPEFSLLPLPWLPPLCFRNHRELRSPFSLHQFSKLRSSSSFTTIATPLLFSSLLQFKATPPPPLQSPESSSSHRHEPSLPPPSLITTPSSSSRPSFLSSKTCDNLLSISTAHLLHHTSSSLLRSETPPISFKLASVSSSLPHRSVQGPPEICSHRRKSTSVAGNRRFSDSDEDDPVPGSDPDPTRLKTRPNAQFQPNCPSPPITA